PGCPRLARPRFSEELLEPADWPALSHGQTARNGVLRDRRALLAASVSGCRSEAATGTCRNPAPARHRTGQNSDSGNCPPASAARCPAPAASAADRRRTDVVRV